MTPRKSTENLLNQLNLYIFWIFGLWFIHIFWMRILWYTVFLLTFLHNSLDYEGSSSRKVVLAEFLIIVYCSCSLHNMLSFCIADKFSSRDGGLNNNDGLDQGHRNRYNLIDKPIFCSFSIPYAPHYNLLLITNHS